VCAVADRCLVILLSFACAQSKCWDVGVEHSGATSEVVGPLVGVTLSPSWAGQGSPSCQRRSGFRAHRRRYHRHRPATCVCTNSCVWVLGGSHQRLVTMLAWHGRRKFVWVGRLVRGEFENQTVTGVSCGRLPPSAGDRCLSRGPASREVIQRDLASRRGPAGTAECLGELAPAASTISALDITPTMARRILDSGDRYVAQALGVAPEE
jgi:hypothetical protein